jgi:DNA-binding protein YbaB
MVKSPFTSLDGAEDWVNNWADSVSEQAARAQALADRVSAMTSSASGAQGAVGVTVDGSGALADLRLDDRVLGWSAGDIAAEILAVMHDAQSGLAQLVVDAAADTVGMDSPTARAVVSSFEQRFPAAEPGPRSR